MAADFHGEALASATVIVPTTPTADRCVSAFYVA